LRVRPANLTHRIRNNNKSRVCLNYVSFGWILLFFVCLGTDLKVWIVEDIGKKMKSDQILRRHLGCDHRRSVIGEVVTPMVILLLCDPAVDVFLLHVVPVIQVLPECSSGLSY